MLLTKSDFINYKECASWLWFIKNKPDVLVEKEIDDFAQGLIDQGEEVEGLARNLFPGGSLVETFHEAAIKDTQGYIDSGAKTIYQATFSDGDLSAMIDILQWNEEKNAWDVYEVKSKSDSSWKKREKIDKQLIDDTGFQRILLQNIDLPIADIYLILLNSDYTKDGPIDIGALFTKVNVSELLVQKEEAHRAEIADALATITSHEEPMSCSCLLKSRKNHCSAFSHLYPSIPEYSIHDLAGIGRSKKKLKAWIDKDILTIDQIEDGNDFKNMRLWQWQTEVGDGEIIQAEMIQAELDKLIYPLYFLDYETLPSAIPKYDGTQPHQHVIFQYSLHTITHDGADPIHKEYLHTSKDSPMQAMAEKLLDDLGDSGSIIVWYKHFEGPKTKELAEMVPDHAEALKRLPDRMYDLMDIVADGYYYHRDFKGSSSIKYVLPVMCPELSYDNLNIKRGTDAMNTYHDLIFTNKYDGTEDQIIDDLLAYCKLDTWAMVRIWEEISAKIK